MMKCVIMCLVLLPFIAAKCTYHGKKFRNKETWTAGDGCNTCTCTRGRVVECTSIKCDPTCTYNGNVYKEGELFLDTDGCNTCTCKADLVACTEKACLAGYCPGTVQGEFGICAFTCNEDTDCEENEKCCPTACGGTTCVTAILDPDCIYDDLAYTYGDSFSATDDCNTCTCSVTDGVSCTSNSCVAGYCPGTVQGEFGICAFTCNEDTDCEENEKCCPTACGGTTCVTAIVDPDCIYDDLAYTYGDSFSAIDDCNTCNCSVTDGVSCTLNSCEPSVCVYDGKEYTEGKSFPSTDGCNMCSCSSNGLVICTLKACEPSVCVYDGKEYEEGKSFPSTDGCNTCSCSSNGLVLCTLKACEPSVCAYGGKEYTEGKSFPSTDGCNMCSCSSNGLVICTLKACAPIKHDGICPESTEDDVCESTCNTDNDCNELDKCCETECGGTVCVTAITDMPDCDGPPLEVPCGKCVCQEGQWTCAVPACVFPDCPVEEQIDDGCCIICP